MRGQQPALTMAAAAGGVAREATTTTTTAEGGAVATVARAAQEAVDFLITAGLGAAGEAGMMVPTTVHQEGWAWGRTCGARRRPRSWP